MRLGLGVLLGCACAVLCARWVAGDVATNTTNASVTISSSGPLFASLETELAALTRGMLAPDAAAAGAIGRACALNGEWACAVAALIRVHREAEAAHARAPRAPGAAVAAAAAAFALGDALVSSGRPRLLSADAGPVLLRARRLLLRCVALVTLPPAEHPRWAEDLAAEAAYLPSCVETLGGVTRWTSVFEANGHDEVRVRRPHKTALLPPKGSTPPEYVPRSTFLALSIVFDVPDTFGWRGVDARAGASLPPSSPRRS
jgi:hypothetical protein